MAYRRPAIEVIQEFQQAAAALALPSLPACIVGPGFQVVDDVNAGIYDESVLAVTSYSYVGLETGAVVDLSAAPDAEAEANVHKSVGLTLKDAYLVKVPTSPEVTRNTGPGVSNGLAAPNLFQDDLTGAFAAFDPDADGAPTFYVDIIDAPGIDAADKGRKLVIGKNDDNELVLAVEWASSLPLADVEYRILEFREEEIYPADEFSNNGISADADSVDVNPGLQSVTDSVPLNVVEADIYLSWRAVRPDLAGGLSVFTDLDSLEAVFGIGSVVPENIGAYAVNLALQNTTTEVNFTGTDAGFFSNEEQSFQSALEFLESKDVYGIAALSHLTAVHQLVKSHVTGMSLSSVGRERVGFVSRKLVEVETLIPASGVGSVTSAGAGNGASGTDNKTFKDPTNGSYITDDVGVGNYLEISAYTAVAGIDRSIAPDERDFFSAGPDEAQILNGAFTGTDVGKTLLARGATTGTNDIEMAISSIVSTVRVGLGVAPTAELMPADARVWIGALSRTIAGDDGVDTVVAATKLWTFSNGSFTSADVGRLLFMASATAPGDNGVFTINSVVGPTQVTTLETPGADETFTGVSQTVYDIVREPARDAVADSVDSVSREWSINRAVFTSDDIGRKLSVAGATAPGNNSADHIIEAIISPTVVRTDNTTTPVTEEFDGLTNGPITTLDVVSVTPSAAENTYITGTRHEIAAIVSESQFTLDTDPTGGFGGTIEDVVYTVTDDLSLSEQADLLAGYASSLGTRRVVSTQPDIFAVSVNSLVMKIPGYFAGPVLAGLTAGLPSQAGFTNLSVSGFVGRENSDDKFSDTQLDTIAGGGNMIFTQSVPGAALSIRHQLTTDVSTIYFQEFSVTKNVDLIARFFRNLFRPFIGVYNITDGLMDMLKTRGGGGIAFLTEQRAPRIGAPLRSGELARIEESADQPDTVEIDISINVPLPLNNIKLTLLV